MARIAGVDLPREKRVEIGLTYIYGIGLKTSQKLLKENNINPDTRVKDLTEDELSKIREIIDRTASARNISSKDREFYRTWTSVWGFGDDVLLSAAELSVGKPYPMTYMNQVLSSWKNGDAMTLDKAKSMGVKNYLQLLRYLYR